jgi:NADH-quinone oxidoreductase subunit C
VRPAGLHPADSSEQRAGCPLGAQATGLCFDMMESLEQIISRIESAVAGAKIDIVPNASPSQQSSLLIDNEHAIVIARFLRDDPALRFDFCSNATGVDWLDRAVTKKLKVKKIVEGEEKEVEETTEENVPGYLEAVYHLYSMTHKHGPVIIRMRTSDRAEGARLPSLTPIYRSAEFQEREIFDLYGVKFDGHPDLRRILMWDEFKDFPMRKDYREPDDYEYEPTPHDDVLERAKQHYAARPQLDGAEGIAAGRGDGVME